MSGVVLTDLEKEWEKEDWQLLQDAVRFFESDSFFKRISSKINVPVEGLMSKIPDGLGDKIDQASRIAVAKALSIAVMTISNNKNFSKESDPLKKSKGWLHKSLAGVSGALGGSMGLASMLMELPISTGIILRSIASIASEFGEDINDPDVLVECMCVFGFGSQGRSPERSDETSTSYYLEKMALSKAAIDAKSFLGSYNAKQTLKSIEMASAPAIMNFVTAVANRFKINITYKGIFKSVPVFGALSGAAVNVAFTDYYMDVAKFHFGLRALSRNYSADMVERAYEKIAHSLFDGENLKK